jgi:signal peptidase II
MARIGARCALLLAIVATIGCDRVTKDLAAENLEALPARSFLADTIRLEYVENTGGFLSLCANLPPRARTALFTGATGVMLLGLVGLAIGQQVASPAALRARAVRGGASNWADRVLRGSVVDFRHVGVGVAEDRHLQRGRRRDHARRRPAAPRRIRPRPTGRASPASRTTLTVPSDSRQQPTVSARETANPPMGLTPGVLRERWGACSRIRRSGCRRR